MRHFPTPSGSNLPVRLQKVAPIFLAKLKASRTAGLITATQGIPAKKICESLKLSKGLTVHDADIRAMVNYWRRNGEPIISLSNGYSYALKPEELQSTMEHLEDRIKAEQSALSGLKRAFKTEAEILQEKLFEEAVS